MCDTTDGTALYCIPYGRRYGNDISRQVFDGIVVVSVTLRFCRTRREPAAAAVASSRAQVVGPVEGGNRDGTSFISDDRQPRRGVGGDDDESDLSAASRPRRVMRDGQKVKKTNN